ncbi:MAG TPA: DUF1214 domain-containing protein [Methylovirgula sp.]
MTLLLKFLATVFAGTVLGLAFTYYVLHSNMSFDEVRAGPWVRSAKSGTIEIDPYAHARLARTGQLPLGSAEGLNFFAWRDSRGEILSASCDYLVKGPIPPTRFWTLSLYSSNGALLDSPAKRFVFTSSDVLRDGNGNVQVAVSREARPGNWLPVGNVPTFALVLRLYDTLFDFGMAKVEASALPQIAKVRCE